MLYEVNANTENWMIAGRKRGHVSLSEKQGSLNKSNLPTFSFHLDICMLIEITN